MLKQPRSSHGSPGRSRNKGSKRDEIGDIASDLDWGSKAETTQIQGVGKKVRIQDQFYFNSIILEINAKSQQWTKYQNLR